MKLYKNKTITLHYIKEYKILMLEFSGKETSYKIETLDNLLKIKDIISKIKKEYPFEIILATSKNKEVWNYGGDLDFFYQCIYNNDKKGLLEYAYKSIDMIYQMNHAFDTGVPTVCLVFGKAYGGGFESALAGNIVIAHEDAKFSFPESNFGSFPGMGAYSILTRKIGFAKAQNIITNNKLLSAKTALKNELIDKIITDEDSYLDVVKELIDEYKKNAFKHIHTQLSYNELKEGVDFWVDQMYELGEKNLQRIKKLLHFQKAKVKLIK
ncbi:crotonase/enoyl-CoA hydratase family protein [Flavobacterium sp.]|uniref:crotonase/enoyl-CoA hydratase family protein n=1 Tax=Flavobacterium sp. TaxID=239 RepID=UPI004047B3CD